MSFLGEFSRFVRVRKAYWLLPVLLPLLAFRAAIMLPKAAITMVRRMEQASQASLLKWRGKLVTSRAHWHSRRPHRA